MIVNPRLLRSKKIGRKFFMLIPNTLTYQLKAVYEERVPQTKTLFRKQWLGGSITRSFMDNLTEGK